MSDGEADPALNCSTAQSLARMGLDKVDLVFLHDCRVADGSKVPGMFCS